LELSRRVLEAESAQAANVRYPQIEVQLPPVDRVVARVPHRPQPAPVAKVEAAPISQPQISNREQDLIEQFAIDVAKTVVSTLFVTAVIWYARTGVWIFEELLAYYIELLK
jgi:hypothetical protein